MPTISEYARARGVSHQYISKLVRRGMTLTSFESADAWRDAHASSKTSTNPVRVARIIDQENDREPPVSHKPSTPVLKNSVYRTDLLSESTLEDALVNARQAADEAWRLLREAMIEGRASKVQVLLSIHNKAVETRFKAESVYREELERRRVLIPLAEAMEMARRGYGVILQRLNILPQNAAHECNPSDPSRAMNVLESECTAILADAQKVYAYWSDDQAPASNSPRL